MDFFSLENVSVVIAKHVCSRQVSYYVPKQYPLYPLCWSTNLLVLLYLLRNILRSTSRLKGLKNIFQKRLLSLDNNNKKKEICSANRVKKISSTGYYNLPSRLKTSITFISCRVKVKILSNGWKNCSPFSKSVDSNLLVTPRWLK